MAAMLFLVGLPMCVGGIGERGREVEQLVFLTPNC